jgi:cobyrinic acid a,c-diamide synthase
VNLPRLVIAGTQSGVGKTSIAVGLVALLRRRGLQVQPFKVGPDYLDPTYLALASGRRCYNLDGWMMGEAYVRELFGRACRDADLAVIEGVMGLFDGAGADSAEGSTAEIARWLDAPVVLIVDAHGMGRSLAATVHGYVTFDPEIRVAGVIANRCGSERHGEWLGESLRSAALPPLVGAVCRGALPELPSRHLGLVTAAADQVPLDRLAAAVGSALTLEPILEAADTADPISAVPPAGENSAPIRRLGVARDEAFHFYYPDNLEALERAGCVLVDFSPLHDRSLPAGLHGLYFGGGYPEEHAAALADNVPMLEDIRRLAADGAVLYAECGGLMYTTQGIETLDGKRHPLVGLVPAWTRMYPRRQSLGYVEVTLTRDSLWGSRGEQLRGHEFHYSGLLETPDWPTAYAVRYRRASAGVQDGFQSGSVLASYLHLHVASRPRAVARFRQCLEQAA